MTLSSRGNDERACAVLEVGSLDRNWEQTHRLHVSTTQTVDALVPAGVGGAAPAGGGGRGTLRLPRRWALTLESS